MKMCDVNTVYVVRILNHLFVYLDCELIYLGLAINDSVYQTLVQELLKLGPIWGIVNICDVIQ